MPNPRPTPLLLLLLLLAAGTACAGRGPAPAPPAAVAHAPFGAPPATAPAERVDATLQAKLEALAAGFEGEVGVYVRHLPSGAAAMLRADELFPTASIVKVPILVGLYDAAERGRIDLNEPIVYHDSLRRTDGEDVVAHFRSGERISPLKLAFLMTSISDNTASIWLQGVVGPHEINRWLAENGFPQTRVNSRTPGREEAFRQWGWGQSTPRETAELMLRIRDGRAVGAAASERMYRLLVGSYWHDEALSPIPPSVQVASKQGAISHSRSEVLLVHGRSGDYVLAVITKNQRDRSWNYDNPGFVLLRRVSETVYRHFNPDDPWRPAEGLERFR